MPFTDRTGDLAPERNAQTGKMDFVFDSTGNPAFDNTKAFAVACAIVHRRGQWAADTRGDRGSLLYTVKNDTRATPSRLEAYALDGMAPLVESGEITNPGAVVSGPIGKRRLDVTYTTTQAGAQTVRLPL